MALRWLGRKVIDDLGRSTSERLNRAARTTVTEAVSIIQKENIIKTGRYLKSQRVTKESQYNPQSGEVTPSGAGSVDCFYAPYLEFGTSTMRPRMVLTRASDRARRILQEGEGSVIRIGS